MNRCHSVRILTVLLGVIFAVAVWAAPKNVILMIGDGMGLESVVAAGAYQYGDEYHAFGGAQRLAFEALAHRYWMTTFSSEGQAYDYSWAGGDVKYPTKYATDSAAAATAMACGVKTYNAAIGMNVKKESVLTVLELAQGWGKKTGLVTSVPLSHATPAAFAAHNMHRNNYQSITTNMLRVTQPDVVMGAGHPDAAEKPETRYTYIAPEDWAAISAGETPYKLLQTREDFLQLMTRPVEGKVLGLFRNLNCLPYRGADNANADPTLPTLAEMTTGALTQLANANGFYLMVEGGAIDWCNHANDLNGSIGETIAFDDAVAAVITWIGAHGGWEENLLIVTADHETGYLRNVTPIAPRVLPTVAWGTEEGGYPNHTNRLVPVYAQGAGSDRLVDYLREVEDFEHGSVRVLDNTDLFPVMRDALCPQGDAVIR